MNNWQTDFTQLQHGKQYWVIVYTYDRQRTPQRRYTPYIGHFLEYNNNKTMFVKGFDRFDLIYGVLRYATDHDLGVVGFNKWEDLPLTQKVILLETTTQIKAFIPFEGIPTFNLPTEL